MDLQDLITQDVTRFQERLALSETVDLPMVLLKGHLLIEEQIQSFLESKAAHPQLLSLARLGFHQRLMLTRAFHANHNRFNLSWVWDAVQVLNSLRNKMVHNFAPADFQDRVHEFTSLIESHLTVPIKGGEGPQYEAARAGLSVSALNYCLTALLKAESAHDSPGQS